MKQTTYSVSGDEERIISEKFFDEHTNLIRSVDYSLKPSEVKNYSYNDKQQKIRVELVLDGRVSDSHEYEYDAHGDVIEQRHLISGELYEKVVLEKSDTVELRLVLTDGEESQRIEHVVDGDNQTYHYYDYGVLVQVNKIEKVDSIITTTIHAVESDEYFTVIERQNEEGKIVESSEYLGNGDKRTSLHHEFDGGQLQKIVHENFLAPERGYYELFTYDEAGNQTKYERYANNDQLTAFEKARFNENKQVIEKAGVQGTQKFHYRIDYED